MFQIIKNSIDLKDLISSETGIEVNRHNKAVCPFHPDKHPSLSIKGDRFRCFACGEAGDVFDFVQKLYNMTPKESLAYLGNKTGIDVRKPLSPPMKKKIDENRRRQERRKRFEEWLNHEIYVTGIFLRWLDAEAEKIGPENFDTPESEFILKELTVQDFLFEILLSGSLEEQYQLYRRAYA